MAQKGKPEDLAPPEGAPAPPTKPLRDEDVLIGGPGQTPPPPPAAEPPARSRVKLAGKEFDVDPDLATALAAREREYAQKMTEQGRELGDLRQRARAIVEPEGKPKEPDLEALWFENPKAAYQKMRQEITDDLEGRYRQNEALRGFWDGFNRKHPELAEEDRFVRLMFQEHYDEIADLPTGKAQAKLAELASAEILRLARKGRESEHPSTPVTPSGRAVVESASGERAPRRRAAEDEDEGPKSLSDTIRARQQARRKTALARPAKAS